MKRLLQNGALVVGSVVLALTAAEIATRLFVGPVPADLRAPWRRNTMRVPESIRASAPFPGVPYVLKPNAEVIHDFGSNPRGYFDGAGTLAYRTNSLGWREREFTLKKPAGTFRVLVIGDSFAFGTGVRQNHVLSSRLQQDLTAEHPGPVEVLNLGVPGYNTSHEVALLVRYGIRLDPDLVVIVFVMNDASTPALRRKGGTPPPLPRRPAWEGHSWLVDHLHVRWQDRARRNDWARNLHADFQADDPGWKRARDGFQVASALGRRRGFRVALVIFPLLWDLGSDYPFVEIHETVAAAARRFGIPVLDLHPAFGERNAESLWVHPSDHHPNEEAHALAARALHDFLVERGLLTGRQSGSGTSGE
jgi:lysophospholipase L1-like esterase